VAASTNHAPTEVNKQLDSQPIHRDHTRSSKDVVEGVWWASTGGSTAVRHAPHDCHCSRGCSWPACSPHVAVTGACLLTC
jgi:hypothetical protein